MEAIFGYARLQDVNVSMYSSCCKNHKENLVVRAQIQIELYHTSSNNWLIISKEKKTRAQNNAKECVVMEEK